MGERGYWNMADSEFLQALLEVAGGRSPTDVYDELWLECSHEWPGDPPHPGEEVTDERSSMEETRKVWVARIPSYLLGPQAEVMIEQFGDGSPTVAFRIRSDDVWGPPHPCEER